MNEITKVDAPAAVQQPEKPFKGYTMEELRYKRAMMALRKEFAKEQILKTVQTLRPGNSGEGAPGLGSKLGIAGTIAKKLLTNLNTIDYIMVGMSAFGVAKKAFKLFRKKK